MKIDEDIRAERPQYPDVLGDKTFLVALQVVTPRYRTASAKNPIIYTAS